MYKQCKKGVYLIEYFKNQEIAFHRILTYASKMKRYFICFPNMYAYRFRCKIIVGIGQRIDQGPFLLIAGAFIAPRPIQRLDDQRHLLQQSKTLFMIPFFCLRGSVKRHRFTLPPHPHKHLSANPRGTVIVRKHLRSTDLPLSIFATL